MTYAQLKAKFPFASESFLRKNSDEHKARCEAYGSSEIEQKCEVCGGKFISQRSHKRKYCSLKCTYASETRVAHVKPKDRGVATCAGCGITFQLKTGGKGKYCSQQCAARTIGKTTGATKTPRPIKRMVEKECPTCKRRFFAWQSANKTFCSTRCAADNVPLKLKRINSFRLNGKKPNLYSRAVKGWIELDGKRFYCKSSWEMNYSYYLQWLKMQKLIADWHYEPQTFWFEGIRRGVCSYCPDFKVILPSGQHEWHEVKGWMDAKSKTKLKRMKKYHPKEIVRVLDAKWFRDANKKLASIVPGWVIKRIKTQ